jgi:hypothetical protein
MRDALIVSALRTPVGRAGGALADVRADDLAAIAVKAVVERSGVDPSKIDDVILGCTNQAGEDNRDVARMAVLLAGLPIEAIYSGPLERVRETATALGDRLRRPVEVARGLDELDFGDWTGRSLDSLEPEPLWQAFNAARGDTRIPGGELGDPCGRR